MRTFKRELKGDEYVRQRLEESAASDRRSRLMLDPVRDIAEAWCLVKPTTLDIRVKLDETRDLIVESVRDCWGPDACVDFDLEPKRRVTARHPDGRQLVIGVEK